MIFLAPACSIQCRPLRAKAGSSFFASQSSLFRRKSLPTTAVSGTLCSTSTPTPRLTFSLHLHKYIHSPPSQIPYRSSSDVLQVQPLPSLNMHYAPYPPLLSLTRPESRYSNTRNASEITHACQCFSEIEFCVFRDGQKQSLCGRCDEWDSGCKDEDSNETRSEGIEARPAGVMN